MDAHQWERFLIKAGIQQESANSHAKTFAENKLSQDLGVSVLGEVLTILKQGTNTNDIAATPTITRQQVSSIPSAKPPRLSLDMSQQQFRKCKIDWDIFIKLTNLDKAKHNMNMYNSADEEVQRSIINTIPTFLILTQINF